MKNLIYYPPALVSPRSSGSNGTTSVDLVRQWHADVSAPSKVEIPPISLKQMEKRSIALESIALSYMHLMFVFFGLSLMTLFFSHSLGTQVFELMALGTCLIVSVALIVQTKKQVAHSQFEKFKLMRSEERHAYRVSPIWNPSGLDLILAIPATVLFVSLWWGR